MTIHQLHRKQHLRISLKLAWEFFSNPRNLKNITPPQLNVQMQDILQHDDKMYPGMILMYSVTPLFHIPWTWVTEITQVKREAHEAYFIDEQRVGPYAFWHHEHFFRPLPNGEVEMEDFVYYKLRFSPLADWLLARVVKRQLDGIFDYRQRQLEKIFQK